MKAFISWSGGKESSIALYKAIKEHNLEIAYLLNMVSTNGKYSRSHWISLTLLKIQAESLGIPIYHSKTSWKTYEENFKKAVLKFKKEDIKVGVFGDIDVDEHKEWIERVCKDLCIKPILPLWREKRGKLLKEFIQLGFKAKICATKAQLLGKEWLGREINKEIIKDLESLENIDLCGENGEYHTFVYDGPIFKKPVKFFIGKKILKKEHWFLELKERQE